MLPQGSLKTYSSMVISFSMFDLDRHVYHHFIVLRDLSQFSLLNVQIDCNTIDCKIIVFEMITAVLSIMVFGRDMHLIQND